MELQKFEPLLLDYALGVTTSEVSALIEAYQDKDADVRTQLEQWRGVAQLARRVIPTEEAVTVPIFPRQLLQTAGRTMWWRRAAVWGAALAACLAVGFFAGSVSQRHSEALARSSLSAGSLVASAPAVEHLPVAAVENFGSPSWWQAMAQRSADRTIRSPSYSIKNLPVLFHQLGG
ncbi:MAG TPA: hypothetical protein VMJ32_02305 [Pirellulales bacterium]|nr:hypothetical protein [Pirellulales bacterium]